MKRLEERIRKNGYEYELLERTYNVNSAGEKNMDKAIYAQWQEYGIVGYEIFFILTQKAAHVKLGETWIDYEEKERFPSDEDFGKTAWSLCNKTIDEAMLIYSILGEKCKAVTLFNNKLYLEQLKEFRKFKEKLSLT